MNCTLSLPDNYDIVIGFRSTDPEDAADAKRIMQRRSNAASGISPKLLTVVKESETGKTFVQPVVKKMEPGKAYSAKELAALLGPGWSTRRVASKLCVLGRPEKRIGSQIFNRPSKGRYLISKEMREALLE